MALLVTMGNFIFCPLMQSPILSNTCIECEYIRKDSDLHYCTYVQENQQPEFAVKDLIVTLLNLMEEGKTSVGPAELKSILNLD